MIIIVPRWKTSPIIIRTIIQNRWRSLLSTYIHTYTTYGIYSPKSTRIVSSRLSFIIILCFSHGVLRSWQFPCLSRGTCAMHVPSRLRPTLGPRAFLVEHTRIRVYTRPGSKHYIAGLSTNNEWGRKNVDDATSPNDVYALKKNSQIIFTPTVSTCLVHTSTVNVLYT